jgi:hypothetical protein
MRVLLFSLCCLFFPVILPHVCLFCQEPRYPERFRVTLFTDLFPVVALTKQGNQFENNRPDMTIAEPILIQYVHKKNASFSFQIS